MKEGLRLEREAEMHAWQQEVPALPGWCLPSLGQVRTARSHSLATQAVLYWAAVM